MAFRFKSHLPVEPIHSCTRCGKIDVRLVELSLTQFTADKSLHPRLTRPSGKLVWRLDGTSHTTSDGVNVIETPDRGYISRA